MKTRLVHIGNSRGVRLPKALILAAGLTDEVELTVQEGAILISSSTSLRQGWAAAAQQLRQRGEDVLLDDPISTNFDANDWEW
jgi:antitoxin MazE